MTRLPIVSGATMEKVLLRLSFEATRRKGSHVFYRHVDGRTTTVPHHSGRDLARPLVREIDLSPAEFVKDTERSLRGLSVV